MIVIDRATGEIIEGNLSQEECNALWEAIVRNMGSPIIQELMEKKAKSNTEDQPEDSL